LSVYEIVALRPEAYRGILTFLSAHNLADDVVLSAGRDVPWRLMVANPHALEVAIQDKANLMVRVVDFPRAVSLRTASPGTELPAVFLRVIDEAAPWNHGTWRIRAEAGHWEAQPAAGAEPEAAADITTIGSMITGFTTVTEAAEAGLLQIEDRAHPSLEALFRTKYRPTSRDHF
jgi:predicted acetyltransferase